jgi:hypothetical protein
VPLPELATLVNGVVAVRVAADAVLELWRGDDTLGPGDRTGARTELTATGHAVTGWYDGLAAALTRRGAVPAPTPPDRDADGRLVDAVRPDLQGADGRATGAAVRVIWTADHLDAVRRLQESLVRPARVAAG